MERDLYLSEIEKKHQNLQKKVEVDLKPQNDVGPRARSSLRMRYQVEVQLIRRDLGGLEDIRNRLGISQRKMCQLLMVDPSAWTRWLKDETKVPPYVFRALSWYVDLKKNEKSYGKWPEIPSVNSRKVSESVILKALLCSNLVLTIWFITHLIFS